MADTYEEFLRKQARDKAATTAPQYFARLNQLPVEKRAEAMGVPSPYEVYQGRVIDSMPKKTEQELAAERAFIMKLPESTVSGDNSNVAPQAPNIASKYQEQAGPPKPSILMPRPMEYSPAVAAQEPTISSKTTPPAVQRVLNPFTKQWENATHDPQNYNAAGYQSQLDKMRADNFAATHRGANESGDKDLRGLNRRAKQEILMKREEVKAQKDALEFQKGQAERAASAEERKASAAERADARGAEVDKAKIEYYQTQAKAEEVVARSKVELGKQAVELQKLEGQQKNEAYNREYAEKSDKFVNESGKWLSMAADARVRDWVGQSKARGDAMKSQIASLSRGEAGLKESSVISSVIDSGYEKYKEYAKKRGIDVAFTKAQFDVAKPDVKKALKRSVFAAVLKDAAVQMLQSNVSQYDQQDAIDRFSLDDVTSEYFK